MGLPPTSSKISTDLNEVTTFKFDFPNFTGTHTGTDLSLGINSVAGGGTGLATLTANNVILGNGTSSPLFVAPGSNGNLLQSNGTTWTSAASSGATPLFYSQAYFGGLSSWSTTSTSFADFTYGGTSDVLTVRQSSGITLTAAASNLPGITFTPNSTSAVYLITVSAVVYNSTPSANISLSLTDGTTTIADSNQFQQSTASLATTTISGIYVPGTTSPVTVKLQGYVSGGTGFIVTNNNADVLEWTVVQLNTVGGNTVSTIASAYLSTNQSASANSAIIFDTVLFDTMSAYNNSTGIWTCPADGYYEFNGYIVSTSGAPGLFLYKNSSLYNSLGVGSGNNSGSFSSTVQATSGDQFYIANTGSGFSWMGTALASGASYFTVTKV